MFNLEECIKDLLKIEEEISKLLLILGLKFSVKDFLGFDKIYIEDILNKQDTNKLKIVASENFRDYKDKKEIKLRTTKKEGDKYDYVPKSKNVKHQILVISNAKIQKLEESEIHELLRPALNIVALFNKHKAILSLIKAQNDLISGETTSLLYSALLKRGNNQATFLPSSIEEEKLNAFIENWELEEEFRQRDRNEFLSGKYK